MASRAILGLLAVLLTPAASALAQDWDGNVRAPYVALGGFWVMPNDSEVRDPLAPGVDVELSSDSGPGAFVAVGMPVSESGRIEVEAAWRRTDFDEITVSGAGSVPVEGTLTAASLMLNGYLDLIPDSSVSPYLGVGAGAARLTVDSADLGADEETDTVFAYQAIAGLASRVSERVTLFGGYRYFATADPTFDGVETEYSSHNIEAGLRIDF